MKAEQNLAIRIASMGEIAAQVLAHEESATVAAVFERSAYIESGGSFVCLGSESIGDGPFNVILQGADSLALVSRLTPGTPISIRDLILRTPHERIDFSDIPVWRPRSWPLIAPFDRRKVALASAEALAAASMPVDGLAPLILSEAHPVFAATPRQQDALARVAPPRIANLEFWLGAAFSTTSQTVPLPLELMGLGPGLTPSGDDVLCGVLAALHALGKRDVASAQTNTLAAKAREATSPLSAQFLRAAAAGQISAILYDFLAASVAADLEALPRSIAGLGSVGHTSGWDTLAGAVLTLRAACSSERPTRRAP